MNIIRTCFDKLYDEIKPLVFRATNEDPQKAHEWFVSFCNSLYNLGLEKIVLDNKSNYIDLPFELSNAAGFNKNGDFPPSVLHYFGFDRVVVGTVTYDRWNGNPRPTIKRYPETESMVNWMGLPGDGAKAVAEKMNSYGLHRIPITINFMSTPQKQGDELLKDIEGTIVNTRYLPYVDRFELNVSCPNTHSKSGAIDTREENLRMLDSMLKVVETYVYPDQKIYLKTSPNSTEADVNGTTDIAKNYRIDGFVTTNTTTKHDRRYIPVSPMINGKYVGGGSGNAVYEDSLRVQRLYNDKKKELSENWKLIACGGINSLERVIERLKNGATGIQIYTPLIFSGTKLIRQMRG